MPSCQIKSSLLKVYALNTFILDFNTVCEDPDGEVILYELIQGPNNMKLNSSVLIWPTTQVDTGIQYNITVLMTNQYGDCSSFISFMIVSQPPLNISLTNQDMKYSTPFRENVIIQDMKYFKVSMFTFKLITNLSDILIDQFGVVT